MESNTKVQEVFVELLGEGTRCLRPTLAQPLGDGRYRLLATADYDPQDEHWAFPPGSLVLCRRESWLGAQVLVARERIQ